jgi:putative intron-encoded nuclease
MGKNQYTFDMNKNKDKWYEWCKLQKVKPLVEYKSAQQIFYFEFLEGKFKGLVGKTYWASINRGSNMRMSCLTPESKNKYLKNLGKRKGIDILEDYKGGRKLKHRFIVLEGKYQGCEGYITLNDLEQLGRVDARSLSEKGRKQYFDKQSKLRDCIILEYPKEYRIKTKDKIVVKDKEGHVHKIIVQDFFDKTSLLELSYASEGEKVVKEILNKNFIKFEKEKSFRNKENRVQRFDFYINENNKEYVIEYNGEQHYKDSSGYFKDTLEITQKRDKLKKEYCKDKGIELLIIPYTITDKKEMEKMILKFLNK